MQSRLSNCLVPIIFGLFCCTCPAVTGGDILTGQSAFGDYTQDAPGVRRKILATDLPPPFTSWVDTSQPLIPRPENVFPQVPKDFVVELFADDLDHPRLLRTAPNGDIFLAESFADKITLFRRNTTTGHVDKFVYATNDTGLQWPFGIAFYPPGPNPTHIYVANTANIIRFNYSNGDVVARGPGEIVTEQIPSGRMILLTGGGHWTRDIAFTKDGQAMLVSVGSLTNVQAKADDNETDRAMILRFNVNGTNKTQYATGIRNAVGIGIHPETGDLWASVNERDGLGDDLVPDYVTRVKEGEFYGWPWFYMGKNIDPRHNITSYPPGMLEKSRIPDVLIQAHSASLQMSFYTGKTFPKEYVNDVFAAQHGSWNRKKLTGYKVVRVLEENGQATGVYEDFVTGFVTPEGKVWGRPVGVTIAHDGSLLISDDGSNSIWRVWYNGTDTNGCLAQYCSNRHVIVIFLIMLLAFVRSQ
ncbi:L-sorbosone dehydrogenase-like [Paramacrobiotus metropolitanus]|uniref:L-sorbosone dehydrogenase-like n=1 Tax=Paramacrobiotus metropolitanus TaxID=2943436 RepID=UPI0024461C82|nr:L-sorbosone dehydrogenase-like [Paramacrobiotus metropolitanus]